MRVVRPMRVRKVFSVDISVDILLLKDSINFTVKSVYKTDIFI